MDYGGHDSIFENNLVMAYPYDDQNCFSMASFFEGHGHIFRNNRCMIGLGHKMGSGCGDPSCAAPLPSNNKSLEVIGNLWSGCKHTNFHSLSNEYYTPSGKAFINCRDGKGQYYSLSQVQELFNLEKGSSVDWLPDEDTMIKWARSMILMNPQEENNDQLELMLQVLA